MERRRVLGLAVAVLGGGCSTATESSRARLGEMQLVNRDSAAHVFHLTIEQGDETVYDESHRVKPAADEPIPVLQEDWPDPPGAFTIATRLDGSGDAETLELTENRCFEVLVEASDGGVRYFVNADGTSC